MEVTDERLTLGCAPFHSNSVSQMIGVKVFPAVLFFTRPVSAAVCVGWKNDMLVGLYINKTAYFSS